MLVFARACGLAAPSATKRRTSASLSPASNTSVRKSPSRSAGKELSLPPLQHEGVFRDAVTVGDAQLLEDPRGRTSGVEGVPATVEQEAVELPGRRAAAQVGGILQEGHARPRPCQVAGCGEASHPASDNHNVRL